MSEKTRFGRVRKTFMEYMREEYGSDIADRTLWRINRRKAKSYFHKR
ncbi:MAG: hypothetical protein WA799_00530 [Nitrosotalea sp.]